MILIREIEYELQEEPMAAFSRLTWVAECVDNLFDQLITYTTVSTHKKWIGALNETELTFGLVKPSSILKPRIFQIIVKGHRWR